MLMVEVYSVIAKVSEVNSTKTQQGRLQSNILGVVNNSDLRRLKLEVFSYPAKNQGLRLAGMHANHSFLKNSNLKFIQKKIGAFKGRSRHKKGIHLVVESAFDKIRVYSYVLKIQREEGSLFYPQCLYCPIGYFTPNFRIKIEKGLSIVHGATKCKQICLQVKVLSRAKVTLDVGPTGVKEHPISIRNQHTHQPKKLDPRSDSN
jgi:hypothetical protein